MKHYLLIAMLLLTAPVALGSSRCKPGRLRKRKLPASPLAKSCARSWTPQGPKKGINISFRQSEKQPFNFVGLLRDGLTNADSLEIVIGVTLDETIGFRIFPLITRAAISMLTRRRATSA